MINAPLTRQGGFADKHTIVFRSIFFSTALDTNFPDKQNLGCVCVLACTISEQCESPSLSQRLREVSLHCLSPVTCSAAPNRKRRSLSHTLPLPCLLAVSLCSSHYVHENMQMKCILSHSHTRCDEGVASEKMLLHVSHTGLCVWQCSDAAC